MSDFNTITPNVSFRPKMMPINLFHVVGSGSYLDSSFSLWKFAKKGQNSLYLADGLQIPWLGGSRLGESGAILRSRYDIGCCQPVST